MPTEIAYIVQAFREGKRGQLVADTPIKASSAEAARRRADALASSVAGVVAFQQSADVESGDYGDPVVLMRHGRVPDDLD